jgi:rare lipoprotein A
MKIIFVLLMLFPVVTVAEAGITSSNGRVIAGTASWYDSESVNREGTCRKEKCFTASGKEIHVLEQQGEMFAAAAKRYHMRSKLRVTNIKTGKSVVVRVLDRGGFQKYGREVDLCKRAFSSIANPREGVIKVTVEVLP